MVCRAACRASVPWMPAAVVRKILVRKNGIAPRYAAVPVASTSMSMAKICSRLMVSTPNWYILGRMPRLGMMPSSFKAPRRKSRWAASTPANCLMW